MTGRRSAWIGCIALSLATVGCHDAGPQAPRNESSTKPAATPRAIGADACLNDLPQPLDPAQAARTALQRNDDRLYGYWQNGESAQQYIAGYEACHGRAIAVRGDDVSAGPTATPGDIMLAGLRDTSRPLDCVADCDYPISACGERRLAWAATYNRVIVESGARGRRPTCPR